MKRIILLITGLFIFCAWIGAQNDKISFNETEHNFGVIGDKDGRVYFDFILTNNSNEPVVVSNVKTTCGCTTPVWTKEPIEPNKTGKITVGYSPSGRGAFSRPVTVYINQLPPVYLTVKGEVVPSESIVKKPTPEEEYPVAIGNYLLKSKDLQFANIDLKEKKTITLEVFNNSDKLITQKVQKLPKHITVEFNPAIISAKTAATVNVNMEVNDVNLYGNLAGEIILLINGVNHSFPYSATVMDDFSKWTSLKKANAGKINVSTSEINFGNLTSGNSRTLKISNSGKSSLNVHNIQSSDPSISVSKPHFVVNPGEIAEIKVIVDSKNINSNISSILSIFTDDPNKPVCEITVIANKRT